MTTSTDQTTRLRLHDSADFCSLVPYLLGYRPDEQLVFVVLEGARLGVTGAIPLAGLAEPQATRHSMMSAVERFTDPMVFLACWTSDANLAEEALAMAEVWLGPEHVLDSVTVLPDRWFSRLGEGASGSTPALDVGGGAAQAVVAGIVASASRAEAVALVAGPGEVSEEVLSAFTAADARLTGLTPRQWRDRAVDLHERALADPVGHSLGRDQLADLAVLCEEPGVREQLWLGIGRRNALVAQQLWGDVVAIAPEGWCYGALVMLGFAAWLSGNGAVMVACIERAEAVGGFCGSLEVLDVLNRDAVPPSLWEQVRGNQAFGVPLPGAA